MKRTIFSQWTVACLSLLITLSSASVLSAEQSSDLRQRLKDPSPTVRKQAAVLTSEKR